MFITQSWHQEITLARFVSPEVYSSNSEKYLRSYTFKSSYEGEADLSPKKQSKWVNNKKMMIKF